jgi:hypothetical protein
MSNHVRPLVIGGLAAACLVLADACNRDLTSPRREQEARRGPEKPNHDIAASEDQFPASAGATSNWTGAQANPYTSGPIKTLPTDTWYRITVNGKITMTPDPRFMPGQPIRTYGPAGYAVVAWASGANTGGKLIGGGTSDSAASDYALMWGNITAVSRGGVGAVNWNAYCGVGYSDPCGNYSGPATTFTFTRLNADLTLTADSTNVAPGSTVTFSYAASPTQVEGKTMPVVVDSVRWDPDTSGQGAEKTEQGFNGTGNSCNSSTQKCTRQIIGSGTFTLIAWVNGKPITKSVHVQTPDLTLRASPTSGPVNMSATFTPNWSDGRTINNADVTAWTWTADSLPGATAQCASAHATCTDTIKENGTMKVSVSRNGVTRTATVHVAVSKCPMGDSTGIADRPEIRQTLKDVWDLSNAHTQPDIANRQEVLYAGYRDTVDGSIFVRLVTGGSPCGVVVDTSQVPKIRGTGKLIGVDPISWTPHSPYFWGGGGT